ncbi:Hypothetical predicted protein, partial [Pelobates cultripes]
NKKSNLLNPDNLESEWTTAEPNFRRYDTVPGNEGFSHSTFTPELENVDTSTK